MNLNELAKRINEISTSHGFWPNDKQDIEETLVMLSGVISDEYLPELERVAKYVQAQEVRNMGEMLMLATSELAEALEEHRSGNPHVYYAHKLTPSTQIPENMRPLMSKLRDNADAVGMGMELVHEITDFERWRLIEAGIAKPEGLAVELADCIIRCLDTLHSLGVDIDQVVREKMMYNESRPYKHGRAY